MGLEKDYKVNEFLIEAMRWKLENGKFIYFWIDIWVFEKFLIDMKNKSRADIDQNVTVNQFINYEKKWGIDKLS